MNYKNGIRNIWKEDYINFFHKREHTFNHSLCFKCSQWIIKMGDIDYVKTYIKTGHNMKNTVEQFGIILSQQEEEKLLQNFYDKWESSREKEERYGGLTLNNLPISNKTNSHLNSICIILNE